MSACLGAFISRVLSVRSRLWHFIPVAGILGPLWLGATIVLLSIVQYDFMRGLGWHPLQAPTLDWPSGLALGRYGFFMTSAFFGCGCLLMFFGWGLAHYVQLAGSRAALLIRLAGLALTLLSFPTDPTLAAGPRTIPGLLHDAAFVLLGVTLFPALVVFAIQWSRTSMWKRYGLYTWATLLCIVPAFIFKGVAFYVFLVGILLWFIIVSLRLSYNIPA